MMTKDVLLATSQKVLMLKSLWIDRKRLTIGYSESKADNVIKDSGITNDAPWKHKIKCISEQQVASC